MLKGTNHGRSQERLNVLVSNIMRVVLNVYLDLMDGVSMLLGLRSLIKYSEHFISYLALLTVITHGVG